jgi:PAS domain S-box-containing protein
MSEQLPGIEANSTSREASDEWLSRPPSSGMYEQILGAAADAIVTINAAQEIVHFNRGAEQMFGYEKAEILGHSLNVLLPEQFRGRHAEYVRAFGESAETARLMGHRREVFGLRKDGKSFAAEASILKLDAPDGRRLYTALVRDVTDRKRMDEQQRFLAMVSGALSGTLDLDETLESVVRLPVPSLADGCDLKVIDDSGRTMTLSHGRSRESADAPPGGEAIQVLPLLARGQEVGVLTLIRADATRGQDSSDLLIAENFAARAALAIDNARLYHAAQHATRVRDEVLGVVSHDLRNPLSVIAMCSRVLIDSPPAEEPGKRDLARTINEATAWMSRMIQDLLDVSAIDAGVLSVVLVPEEIGPILERSVGLFTRTAADRGVGMSLDVAASLPLIRADAERLVQAIANLVGNAVKFTPAAGRVAISARSVSDGLEVLVEDTGRGISAEDLPHIFDRYWHSRGSSGGTGLGLAIAKGIVEAHGGQLNVTSVMNIGSKFQILLPTN